MKQSQLFRHGLNILIKPSIDIFSLVPSTTESTVTIPNLSESQEKLDNPKTNELDMFNNENVNHNKSLKIEGDHKDPFEITIKASDILISEILIEAAPNSKATILIRKEGDSEYVSTTIKVIAKENAQLTIVTIQNFSNETTHVQRHLAKVQKSAKLNWVELALGSAYTKSDIITNLESEGAETDNTVLYLGNGNQKYDIYTASIHNAPNTSSNIVTRGVLNGSSKGLSRGLVKINENAPGSNGYEKQDALILSDDAEADAIPNLEIHNNDVKCSHGSTVGQVDEELLFYLMSRGLDEQSAKAKIVEGYFLPILDLFKEESLKEQIHTTITNALG